MLASAGSPSADDPTLAPTPVDPRPGGDNWDETRLFQGVPGLRGGAEADRQDGYWESRSIRIPGCGY